MGIKPTKRLTQATCKLGCVVIIKAKYDLTNDALVIYSATESQKHNHVVSKDLVQHYPCIRKLDRMEKTEATKLLHDGVTARKVQQKLNSSRLKSSKCGQLTGKDLHNLKSNMRTESDGDLTDVQLVNRTVDQMLYDHQGTVVKLFTEKDVILSSTSDQLVLVFIQTSFMEECLRNHPDIFFVDTTYRLNQQNLNLLAVVVQDQNGFGQPAALFFIPNEKQTTIKKAFDLIICNSQPGIIFVDEDFSQMSVLQEVFPLSVMCICAFHTLKIWKTQIAKERLDTSHKAVIFKSFRELLYIRSVSQFFHKEKEFKNLLSTPLKEYYEANWEHIRHQWTMAYRFVC